MSPGSPERRATQPTLELYWGGFSAWWLRHLERRWTRNVLIDRLKHAALDVGEALVVGPGAQDQLRRFAWLVDVAAEARLLEPHELQQARRAIQTTQALLPARPAA